MVGLLGGDAWVTASFLLILLNIDALGNDLYGKAVPKNGPECVDAREFFS
jgi:hypothetical protein